MKYKDMKENIVEIMKSHKDTKYCIHNFYQIYGQDNRTKNNISVALVNLLKEGKIVVSGTDKCEYYNYPHQFYQYNNAIKTNAEKIKELFKSNPDKKFCCHMIIDILNIKSNKEKILVYKYLHYLKKEGIIRYVGFERCEYSKRLHHFYQYTGKSIKTRKRKISGKKIKPVEQKKEEVQEIKGALRDYAVASLVLTEALKTIEEREKLYEELAKTDKKYDIVIAELGALWKLIKMRVNRL